MLAAIAFVAPFGEADVPARVGVLLILAAMIEIVHGSRRAAPGALRQASIHGLASILLGVFLINAPLLAGSALLLLLAGGLLSEGVGLLFDAVRRRGSRSFVSRIVGGGVYVIAAVLLVVLGRYAMGPAVALAVGMRIARSATGIATADVFEPSDVDATVVADLRLPDHPQIHALAAEIAQQERDRAWVDRGWIIGFIVTLFAIHLARMGFDRSFLGIFSPAFAVLGDVFVALVIAFALVVPGGALFRHLTSPVERRLWGWTLAGGEPPGYLRRAARLGLARRLRARVRLRMARYSLRAALGRGLQIGLPASAVIAATTPIWGMSWYFDTENWAAGVWNSWAEQRTDTWREAMIEAEQRHRPTTQPSEAFAVHPPGLPVGGDFSFIVIGDPGEGDASQHSLRATYLDVVRRDDVKFVVISSDVVYPTGAMRDYEAKFWIPFMGTTKPVYAIPGNHDWYDALEGFAATFLAPRAAKTAMIARIEADRRVSSSNEASVDRLIATATRLRGFYGVPTQQQTAPFFQMHTDTFALFAVDTGIARRIDPKQMKWLRDALGAAAGKTKMVILGHPFYAGGRFAAVEDSDFAELHDVLRQHEVTIVMAGDTHDLEYYREGDGPRATHHFVNGGGGAYLSFGTPLDWPAQPDAPVWVYYPNRADVVAKIRGTTPWWKRPAWWWTEWAGAWPFSAEFVSAAFDVNAAPFFQSFLEIRVEPSQRRLRVIPWGVHGRVRWADFDRGGQAPIDADPNAWAEWVFPTAELSEVTADLSHR
jgi:3',5'-cyclic AMP phosphodiesterase CpdA